MKYQATRGRAESSLRVESGDEKNKAAPCKATSETKLEMKNENKGTIDEGFMLCAEITEMSNKMTRSCLLLGERK